MKTRHRTIIQFVLVLGLLIGARSAAAAGLTWLGVNQTSASGGVYDDVAYDSKHNVYLHVWEANRNVWARFINANGSPAGSAFVIPGAYIATFAGNPRVAYSEGTSDDVFFVGFSSDINIPDRSTNVFGQLVRYTGTGATAGTLVGGNFPVSAQSLNGGILQKMNDVAYNAYTRQFITVWDDSRNGTDVFVRLFNVDGSAAGGEVDITNANWSQGAASVAVDWEHNRYFVVYQGLHPDSPAFPEITGAWAKILDGTTAAPLTGLLQLQVGGAPLEMDTVYLPESDTFLAFWTAFTPDGRRVYGRQVPYNSTGNFSTDLYPVMSSAGEGGANGMYNPATRTVLLTSMFLNGRVRGAELSGTGSIVTPSFTISTVVPSAVGSFWPRVAAGPSTQFAFVYGVDYASAWLERYQGVAASTPGPSPQGSTPACSITAAVANVSRGPASGSAGVSVTGDAGCAWQASSNASWLSVGTGSGSGPGTLVYSWSGNLSSTTRSATITVAGKTFTVTQTGPVARSIDFNFDGYADIIWQNQATGKIAVWEMRGSQMINGDVIASPPDINWKIRAVGDISGDKSSDLLWQNESTGYLAGWSMNGTQMKDGYIIDSIDPANTLVASGDLDGDGKLDLVFQDFTTGTLSAWLMNYGVKTDGGILDHAVPAVSWRVVGSGDFDGDGRADLVLRDSATGWVALWFMNGRALRDGVYVSRVADTNWKLGAVTDLNGDGSPDMVWHHQGTGQVAVWFMRGPNLIDGAVLPYRVTDFNWQIVGPR